LQEIIAAAMSTVAPGLLSWVLPATAYHFVILPSDKWCWHCCIL